MPLLAATNNRHKIREFRRILEPLDIHLVTPDDVGLAIDVAETGTTFAENALLKARAFATASGLPALADDSGLVVDALGGEPGIYSARYGGPDLDDAGRTALVLSKLNGVPKEARTARFLAAVALSAPPTEHVVEAGVEGLIAGEARGDNGFGYDPIFYYPDFGVTFGEAEPWRKDTVSHRAQALRKMAYYLRESGACRALRSCSKQT